MRILVLSVVVLLAVVLLTPTVRAALDQRAYMGRLNDQLTEAQAEAGHIDDEIDRWDDPSFIEAQARERLGFVQQGDRVWRTVGGDDLLKDIDPVSGLPVEAGIVGAASGPDIPWYTAIRQSVRTADGPAPPTEEEAPSD
ncbi:MAG: septum formation initiator family protein [Cellulomonadaceae bacterium]|nr:septum formation initiator family protein [Cellulomonadaceae bacterium]